MSPGTVALGDCFRWAAVDALENGGMVVHGTVYDPWSRRRYPHAWTVRGGRVRDWQMSAAGTPDGVDEVYFKKTRRPLTKRRYAGKEAAAAAVKHGHWGPWEG